MTLTPKEKAKELVNKMHSINSIRLAKQCALIAVDEIMNMPNIGYSHNKDKSQYDYWREVKIEIGKL